VEAPRPADLPPGIYRLRLDYGLTVGSRHYSLQARTFATYGFSVYGKVVESHHMSPPIPASGEDVTGRYVQAPTLLPEFRSCS
jgi:hypothetical protein